ncbi:MAG: hypothetical protein KDA62_14775 [Planctomycetales bacterium]|nr:hypothetical protein [Planctomycetales bacterium]
MSATIFVAQTGDFVYHSLAFETYKEWIREAFEANDPVTLKVFEPVEQGFHNRLYLDELDETDYCYFWGRLLAQDRRMEQRLRENPGLEKHVAFWNEILDCLHEDDRMRIARNDYT